MTIAVMNLSLSLPRVINLKFPLQPHQKYNITQYGELGFSKLTQMKDDYTTNSHYLIYTFSVQKVGRMYFSNLGVEGLGTELPGQPGKTIQASTGIVPRPFATPFRCIVSCFILLFFNFRLLWQLLKLLHQPFHSQE